MAQATAGRISAGKAFVEIVADKANLIKGLKSVQRDIKAFGQSLKDLGSDMFILGGFSSVPLLKSIKMFAEFDDRIRTLKGVSGATESTMQDLKETIMDLGATTAFTANQVADGAIELARIGFEADEVKKAIKPTLDLVRATGESVNKLGEYAGYASSVLKIFKKNAEDFNNVTNIMAYSANRSAMSIADYYESMKMAGPYAQMVGESIEGASSALMLMANMGVRGSLAGTSLRNVYQVLAATAGKLTDVTDEENNAIATNLESLETLGIRLKDTRGNLLSVAQIMDSIKNKLKEMPKNEKLNFLIDQFGLRGSLGASSMLNDYDNYFQDQEKALKNLLKAEREYKEKISKHQESGAGGFLRGLISRWEAIQITVGEGFWETIKNASQAILGFVSGILKFIQENKKLVSSVVFATGSIFTLGIAIFGVGMIIKILGASLGMVIKPLQFVSFFVIGLTKNFIIFYMASVKLCRYIYTYMPKAFITAYNAISKFSFMFKNLSSVFEKFSNISNLFNIGSGFNAFININKHFETLENSLIKTYPKLQKAKALLGNMSTALVKATSYNVSYNRSVILFTKAVGRAKTIWFAYNSSLKGIGYATTELVKKTYKSYQSFKQLSNNLKQLSNGTFAIVKSSTFAVVQSGRYINGFIFTLTRNLSFLKTAFISFGISAIALAHVLSFSFSGFSSILSIIPTLIIAIGAATNGVVAFSKGYKSLGVVFYVLKDIMLAKIATFKTLISTMLLAKKVTLSYIFSKKFLIYLFGKLTTLGKGLSSVFLTIGKGIVFVVSKTLTLKNLIAVLKTVKLTLQGIWAFLSLIKAGAIASFLTPFLAIGGAVIAGVYVWKRYGNAMKSAFKNSKFLNDFKRDFSNAWKNIKDTGTKTFASIKEAFEVGDLVGGFKIAFAGIKDMLLEAIDPFIKRWFYLYESFYPHFGFLRDTINWISKKIDKWVVEDSIEEKHRKEREKEFTKGIEYVDPVTGEKKHAYNAYLAGAMDTKNTPWIIKWDKIATKNKLLSGGQEVEDYGIEKASLFFGKTFGELTPDEQEFLREYKKNEMRRAKELKEGIKKAEEKPEIFSKTFSAADAIKNFEKLKQETKNKFKEQLYSNSSFAGNTKLLREIAERFNNNAQKEYRLSHDSIYKNKQIQRDMGYYDNMPKMTAEYELRTAIINTMSQIKHIEDEFKKAQKLSMINGHNDTVDANEQMQMIELIKQKGYLITRKDELEGRLSNLNQTTGQAIQEKTQNAIGAWSFAELKNSFGKSIAQKTLDANLKANDYLRKIEKNSKKDLTSLGVQYL